MAKIVELVNENCDTELWHPEIGRVTWSDRHNVFVRYLTHTEGPDEGKLLYTDWEVLNGDRWELYTE